MRIDIKFKDAASEGKFTVACVGLVVSLVLLIISCF